MTSSSISQLLENSWTARKDLIDSRHETAFRLFNGFIEGCPDLVVEVFGTTAVIHNHADHPDQAAELIEAARQFLQSRLPWLQACLLKVRSSPRRAEQQGRMLFGETVDRSILEAGVRYAIDLGINIDAGFYLDTRGLRKWLLDSSSGWMVLNTFAYTGSLGVAALAGGASRVVQLDRSRRFLELARASYALNHFPIHKQDFIASDFFPMISRFKRDGQLFDCVILDPPFQSTTARGTVDLVHDNARLINKVRPLIKDGGRLVAINNALFVSGQDYMHTLEQLCQDGYLTIEKLVEVPQDCTGYPGTRLIVPVTDPSPFNHSTKIAILHVKRK